MVTTKRVLLVILIFLIFFIIVNIEYLDFKKAHHAAFGDNEWVGVTHFLLNNDSKSNGRWLYHNPRSEIEFNLGKTIAFNSHAELNLFFDKKAATYKNIHSVSKKVIRNAIKNKYESIQILEHDKDPDKIKKFEIIDLQFQRSYKDLKKYRSKKSLRWKPFPKFTVSNAFGPNFKLSSM